MNILFICKYNRSRSKIFENHFILARFLEQEAFPKEFGKGVEVTRLIKDEEDYSYRKSFDVTFTTKLRTMNFKEKHQVYGVELCINDIHLRIFKNNVVVTARLVVSS